MSKTLEKIKEYKNMRDGLANIDTHRGGGANQLKGFSGEVANASLNNIDRINRGQKARIVVIDNNSAADSVIVYENGQTGRAIQDKMGYKYSDFKKMIAENKYEGMILCINKDNPIFNNEAQLQKLMKDAKEHGIKIVPSNVSSEEMLVLAKFMQMEGELRAICGLNYRAPLTATTYTAGKAVTNEVDNYTKTVKNQIKTVNKNIDKLNSKYISEEFSRINKEGLNAGYKAAIFTASVSTVSNLYKVAKGEKELNEAVYTVLSDTVKSGCTGYASGALMAATPLNFGQANLVVNATINLSKQLYAFADGQINEEQLVSNIATESVHLAGSYIGGVIGQTLIPIPIVGHMVGAVVGEIVTSLVCNIVTRTHKLISSEFVRVHELDKQNKKLIALYKNAEREIKESQGRLKELIDAENDELIKTIENGFESLMVGIRNGNYDDIVKGIVTIGSKFGLTEQELKKDLVTRDNLFTMSDDLLIIE